MGKKDREAKVYFSDKRRYADLWNGGVFRGKQLVKAELLQDVNPVSTEQDRRDGVEQTRDLVMKQLMGKQALAVWVLENQVTVDYSMPVKVLLREAMEYHRQMRDICRENRDSYARFREQMKNKEQKSREQIDNARESEGQKREEQEETAADLRTSREAGFRDAGEFLYQFRREDRLVPVATLVVYWGEEWTGPRTLQEVIDFSGDEELAEELRRLVPEYPLHFLNLSRLENYASFQTELRTLFELYACREDKEKFREYIDTHEECRHMDEETFRMLGTMTHSRELQAIRLKEEEEEVDMCNAIRDLIMEGKAEGREEGREEGRTEGKAETVAAIRNMNARKMETKMIAELMNRPQEYVGHVVSLILEFPGKEDLAIARMLVEEGR